MVPKLFNEVKKKKFEKRLTQQKQQKQLQKQTKPEEDVNILESITNNNDINDNELRTLLFFILALQFVEEFLHIISFQEGQVNLNKLPQIITRKTSIDYYNMILKVFALFWSLIPCNISHIQQIVESIKEKSSPSQVYKIVCENLKTNLILEKIFRVRRPVLIGKGCHAITRDRSDETSSHSQQGGGGGIPIRPIRPIVPSDILCSTMTGLRMDETNQQIKATNTLAELVGNIALYIHRISIFYPDFYQSLVDCSIEFDQGFSEMLDKRTLNPNKKMQNMKKKIKQLKIELQTKK
jgi:hypothetical protein